MKIIRQLFVAGTCVLAGQGFAQGLELPTGTTGAGDAFALAQPGVVLSPLIQTDGAFEDLATVKFFGGNFAPRGYMYAHGQSLDIASHAALFSKMGTTYGGDGLRTFKLPDLRGRAVIGAGGALAMGDTRGRASTGLTEANMPVHSHATPDGFDGPTTSTGSGEVVNIEAPALALEFEVITRGRFPSRSFSAGPGSAELTDGMLGAVTIDAAVSDGEDRNVLDADGRTLPIVTNDALFSILGTIYGGDGRTGFDLPDTIGRVVTGAGDGPGREARPLGDTRGTSEVALTEANLPAHAHELPDATTTESAGAAQPVSLVQPEISMNWVVALNGRFPSRSLTGASGFQSGGFSGDEPMLGEIGLFAGSFAPRGWALAEGQLLSIASNSALFAIYGTQYGGDGRTTFALPDLRGRTAIGSGFSAEYGQTFTVGQAFGSEAISLDAGHLPEHSHGVTPVIPPVPLPAGVWMLLGALGGLGLIRRATSA